MNIRQYRTTDEQSVWNLHNLALEGTGAHAGNGPWDADLKNIEEVYISSGGDFLVGELDEMVIAIGALKKSDFQRVELKRMRVHPSHQRSGYGQMMLNALEDRAVTLGFRLVHLDTTTIQVAAQKLYEKNGYRKTGKDRFGAYEILLYEKELPTRRRRQSREAAASQDA